MDACHEEIVTCRRCKYELERSYAFASLTIKNEWICKICYSLYEEPNRLISFDHHRYQDQASASRRKRAETLSKAPRAFRENIQFLPLARNTRAISYQRDNEVSICSVCEKSGVTLVKEKGKNFCIYCYYHHRTHQ